MALTARHEQPSGIPGPLDPRTLPYEERLAATQWRSTVTAVQWGAEVIPVSELSARKGITLERWRANIVKKQVARTHCTLGGEAITLAQFEASHPFVMLGEE